METILFEHDAATQVATLTFDEPGSPVNTMSRAWQADLGAAVERLAALQRDGALRGVILASAKRTFFAGAQLQLVMQAKPEDAAHAFAEIEQVKRCYRRLETLGVPVVACLNGSALGGGWEVALAAHARIALDVRPRLRIVSIMPGMDIAPPERTDTRSGAEGSPRRLPVARSTPASCSRTSSIRPAGISSAAR